MSSVQEMAKENIIKEFGIHEKDCGSSDVQIAILTSRIQRLTNHFQTNRDDKHSMRGMMKMIARRKKLLSYLRADAPERYRAVIKSLGLRK